METAIFLQRPCGNGYLSAETLWKRRSWVVWVGTFWRLVGFTSQAGGAVPTRFLSQNWPNTCNYGYCVVGLNELKTFVFRFKTGGHSFDSVQRMTHCVIRWQISKVFVCTQELRSLRSLLGQRAHFPLSPFGGGFSSPFSGLRCLNGWVRT